MEAESIAPIKPISPPLGKALDIIKKNEGCVLHAYPDPATGGKPWTIGWGHTDSVQPGQVITQEQADHLLGIDVDKFTKGVLALCKVELTNNELSALVSFVYNLGLGSLESSTLLRKLNEGYPKGEVAYEFLKWDHAGGRVLRGLTRRRREERALFLAA